MKKNLQRLILSPLIFCLLLCFTVLPVHGFGHIPKTLTVTKVSESGDVVYLNNDCIMYQSDFHKYSGEDFDLEYGDLIKVYCCALYESFPGQFAWGVCGEEPRIEYLGKADDYADISQVYDHTTQRVTVMGINEDTVYLTNGCTISQSEFHKYSGEDFDLKYGDLIDVYCCVVNEIFPSQFAWGACGEEPKIVYLGKAAYRSENKKELVVTKKSDDCCFITFEDSDGREYPWQTNLYASRYIPSSLKDFGCKTPPEYDPSLINVGDKLYCIVSAENYYDDIGVISEKEYVYLPVSKEDDVPPVFEPVPLTLTVVGVSENGDAAYLDNDCRMHQSEFHKYSGKEFDLEYGDVIKVYCSAIAETYPSQFVWGAEPKIEYLGKAADYFENKKELVVTEKSDDCYTITFEDSDGTEYVWRSSLCHFRDITSWHASTGCVTHPEYDPALTEYDPSLINVGDKLLCVVSTQKFYDKNGAVYEKEGVYLPVSKVESDVSNFDILAVMGTSESGDAVYLTNGCKMSQSDFHKYSGENFDLKYGDAIKVYCCSQRYSFPGSFEWNTESKIEYLGKALKYFENQKVLSVIGILDDSDIIAFEDSDGTEYVWKNSFWRERKAASRIEAIFDYVTPPEFDPDIISAGDKFLCVVLNDGENETVCLPVSKIESNSTFSIANLVYMQKYLTHSYEDSIKRFSNYDLNDDGSIDVFDVIILRRMILSKNLYIY